MSGKKLLGKPKQYCFVKCFDMYACKIQKYKFGSVLTAACPANSRKAYCKVCNNSIINRFFAFNCCKKDRNNTEHFSESFGAVDTLRRQGSAIPFKMHHVLLSRAPGSETYFTFFSSKVPYKIIFTTFK